MTSRLLRAALVAALALPAAARAGSNTNVSGSVYVDYWGILDKTVARRSPASTTPDISLSVGVDIHDDLSFSAKVCVSCHGIEPEHAYLDFTPKTWFNVQVGRLLVPFGEWPERLDPGSHKTASAPLIWDMGRMAYGERSAMNLGVVPQPYVDTGAELYGTFWLGSVVQVWYGGYGVSGLRGGNDADWIAMRATPYTDNNRTLSYGGRGVLTYSSEPGSFFGDASIGGSYSQGKYDKEARLGYVMWGADASLRLGPFTLRGEYASRKTDLDPTATGYRFDIVDPYFNKTGYYAELEHPLGRYLAAVYRYDELRRQGLPLPSSTLNLSPDSTVTRYTGGLVVTPAQSVYMKLSWEYWQPTDFERFHSFHVGLGGAF